MKIKRSKYFAVQFLIAMALLLSAAVIHAQTAAEIDRDVNNALIKLYSTTPAAKQISKNAKGILVFPNVVKGGFIIGGQYGVGALRKGDKTVGYYNTTAASYGLQAGAQSFGYAMFFMNDDSLGYLNQSSGWDVGVGPSLVVADEGVAKSYTAASLTQDIYVFFFSQHGLMGGLGVQGSKITRVNPD